MSNTLLANEGRLEFDGDSNNQFGLALLRYRFPIGSNTNFYLAATGNGLVELDASARLNPYSEYSLLYCAITLLQCPQVRRKHPFYLESPLGARC